MDANDTLSSIGFDFTLLQLGLLSTEISTGIDFGIKDVDTEEAAENWNSKYSKAYSECNVAVMVDALGGAENAEEEHGIDIDNVDSIDLQDLLSIERAIYFVNGVAECPGSEEVIKILVDTTIESLGVVPGDCDYKGILITSGLISFSEELDNPEEIISEKDVENFAGEFYNCFGFESFLSRSLKSLVDKLIEEFELLPKEEQSKLDVDIECFENFVDEDFLNDYRDSFIESIKAATYPDKYDSSESEEQLSKLIDDKFTECAPELV